MKKIATITLGFVFISALLLISCEKEKKTNPVITIVEPANNTSFNEGEVIEIYINTSDEDGTISQVQFYIDNKGFTSATKFPYSVTLDLYDYQSGSHIIKATSIDDEGNSTDATVQITIEAGTGGIPDAGFTVSKKYGEVPLTVTFSDTSSHNPTEWLWSFSDGSTSTVQNPTVTFTTPNYYTASLTVVNRYGTDTKTKYEYIHAVEEGNPPYIDFECDAYYGERPLEISFTDLSQRIPNQWLWDFGDGTTSTDQNPTHIYTDSGWFDVTLTATNDYGSNSDTWWNCIHVQ